MEKLPPTLPHHQGKAPSGWKPGDKIKHPVKECVAIDVSTLPAPEAYRLLISGIIPRPIAFVSTRSSAGINNLAPFSFYCGVSSNPPCLAISIARKPDGSKKDTLRNIEETKQFVVNSSHEWLAEPLVHCAATYPYGVDEMEKVGLTALQSLRVLPPRVAESALHYECELYKTVEVGDGGPGSSTLVLGKILHCHVSSHLYANGRIDFANFQPLSRLGGISYAALGDVFELEIPKV
jgi:flavin reductase (DIM6/NTAB) family NADH-FMN oxidoreductase RutF